MTDYLIPSGGVSTDRMEQAFADYRSSVIPFQQARAPQQRFLSLDKFISQRPIEHFSYELLTSGLSALDDRVSRLEAKRLPYERCVVGISDPARSSFGGFHSEDHGYRHLEQLSVSSVLGAFRGDSQPLAPKLRAMDLLRAIAHDTIHHSSYRIYRIRPGAILGNAPLGDTTYRWQYGINFRRVDGVSYSPRDLVAHKSTRNLGVIMDAVTDDFATTFIRDMVLSEREVDSATRLDSLADFVRLDISGTFTESHFSELKQLLSSATEIMSPEMRYLDSLRQFQRYVILRGRNFLREFGEKNVNHLRDTILRAILSGKLRALSNLLNDLTGSKTAFKVLFLQPKFRMAR